MEHVLQKREGPYFFPDGGLSAIPKTLRIRIRTRLVALLLACNLIPLRAILDGFRGAFYSPHDPVLHRNRLEEKSIRWVRAGHDPGLIYNPATDSFEELVEKVLPIGVSEDSEYKESHQKISPGQVITIGTDGIWEARNEKGEIFGKNAFKNIIRTRAKESAEEILNAEIDEVENFTSPRAKEDDLTLVVIKVKQ